MEANEDDASATTLDPGNPRQEPTFAGRLQLQNFMFAGADHGSPSAGGPRRSPRLAAPRTAVVSPGKRSLSSDAGSGRARAPRSPSPSPRKKKRRREPTGYAPPATYAHLAPLPDALAPGLLVLTVGLNPGVETARTGHAYAHPSNLYWRLLHASGVTPTRCAPADDRDLPRRYAVGHTNLVARPTRRGAELSPAELDAGVAALERKCRRWRPEVVCLVGKGIWESVARVRDARRRRRLAPGAAPRLPKRFTEFHYGWQDDEPGLGAVLPGELPEDDAAAGEEGEGDVPDDGETPWPGSRIFVATSTSGLAASLRPAEKEQIWKILGDWCVKRRKEREAAAGTGAGATADTAGSTSNEEIM
ncbi:DNA glycosylase [Durotheca rogersii]|uniref:DNA glycosylase n=1 Tax=Durotheca rogersii TaxID=419775 RepID=UPI00221F642F|nr:DNA glycosylase [Durotheca rogersii]KAI5864798.1 DNA glycosylase [Durotheca rogersii]